MTAVNVETEGITETLRAVQGLDADLRRTVNGELRAAAGKCANELGARLHIAAASSPTPQAALVARTIKVKSDRIPVVSIGGNQKVGRYGARASALQWGSEQGGKNFVAAKGGNYWIKPTVDEFADNGAIAVYRRAVYEIMHKWGLV
jgi:hypothetical protein